MLFHKLFNFLGDDLKKAERRLINRYTMAPGFPLTATVVADGPEVAAKVVDMSAGGVGLILAKAPLAGAGAAARLNFDLAGTKFGSGATIRHMRPEGAGVHCGLEVGLDDPTGRRAFLQLLIPVSIGATLTRAAPTRSPIPEPNLERLAFEGDSGSKLTVWCRTDPQQTPESFEFQVDDYFVRGHGADPELHAFSLVDDDRPHRAKDTAPLFKINTRLEQEIRQLFRWSTLNMRDNVPAEVKAFLATFRVD